MGHSLSRDQRIMLSTKPLHGPTQGSKYPKFRYLDPEFWVLGLQFIAVLVQVLGNSNLEELIMVMQ